MRNITLGLSGLTVPAIAVGCMRITSVEKTEAERFIKTALELGAFFFDHADIYGQGECEERFAEAIGMNPRVRESICLQSKCGIRSGVAFDFSKEHILAAADGILKRLKTEYLDVLLLHRPDALMEPEEVAEAFNILHNRGKVRHFGVSNHNPYQIRLLTKYVRQPIVVNQLQLSITNSSMISQGLHVNMSEQDAVDRDGGVLDFCRLKDITIQTWSPLQYGFFDGPFLGNKKFPKLNAKIDEIAAKYGVSNTTIAVAWLLRHPAQLQPVIGTWKISRFAECVKAAEIKLSREEWYALFIAAGNTLP
ncbi:MAG: aldo/keto reductase [Spirochaetaceae bacterium]|nr:aldo/keto reductase [Spirochaetaceae bacterium]